MACDGHIDQREVGLIKDLGANKNLFGNLDIQQELENLVKEINLNSKTFLKSYFQELKSNSFNEEEELSIIATAVKTIDADEKVEYSEIKFFKVIRSKLKVSNKRILEIMPDTEEYLQQDIIYKSIKEKLLEDYFAVTDLPEFGNFKVEH